MDAAMSVKFLWLYLIYHDQCCMFSYNIAQLIKYASLSQFYISCVFIFNHPHMSSYTIVFVDIYNVKFNVNPKCNLSNRRSAWYSFYLRFTDNLIIQQNKSMISQTLEISLPLLHNYVNHDIKLYRNDISYSSMFNKNID